MRASATPDWLIQLAWWVSGIFGTGAVWYFLSTEHNYAASICVVLTVASAAAAIALHLKKDRAVAEEVQRKLRDSASSLTENPTRANVIETVLRSDAIGDWDEQPSRDKDIRTYKKDINLRFEMLHGEDGYQCRDFREPWANKFPDQSATGYWCDLYYATTLIERFILVAVDGGRALLPIPKLAENGGGLRIVLPIDYKVAQIHDTLRSLNQYFRQSGLELQNAT